MIEILYGSVDNLSYPSLSAVECYVLIRFSEVIVTFPSGSLHCRQLDCRILKAGRSGGKGATAWCIVVARRFVSGI